MLDRLSSCSTGFSIFFKRADWSDRGVFFAAKLFFPLFFLLSKGGLECSGLTSIEV